MNFSTASTDEASRSEPLEPPSSGTAPVEQSAPSLLQSLGGWIRSITHKNENTLKEALAEVLDEHEEQAMQLVTDDERTLLRNMIAFGELTVGDVMVPRPDIFAVEVGVTLEELKHYVIEKRHTRIPVFTDSLDRVSGFIHAKDLTVFIAGDDEFDIEKVLRKVLFVPRSMRCVDLLMQMRSASCHMAIVVDEYGGTDGLVTMEDVFEELVGDIRDEHDREEDLELKWKGKNTLVADARIEIDDLEETLGCALRDEGDDDEYDTIGGLIFAELGRVPTKGEVIQYHDGQVKFEILSADPRRIYRVKITRNFTPKEE